MSLSVERYSGSGWVDITSGIRRLTHSLTISELEKLEMEIMGVAVGVGERVRMLRNSNPIFEGIIYERELIQQDTPTARYHAYSELILYETHIIYRSYPTGTTAGEIIRDLAGLVEEVDVSNVEDGPALTSDWQIQNETALEIMRKTAKGTNHLLRMKPGRQLHFKAKTIGNPSITIENNNIISAHYSEDRWRQRNRVVYVGSGGTILADVSEPPADLPLIIHDPFLTDVEEALRRANVRLELCREVSRQLDIEIHRRFYETFNIDVGDTVRVNLPSLGIANMDMVVIEITYQPQQMRAHLTVGGRLEYLEQVLGEIMEGETASLFGQQTSIPELITSMTKTLNATFKLHSRRRTIRLEYTPPIRIDNPTNIIIDSNGYAGLVSGATQGSFECSCLPASELFDRWLRIHYSYEAGDGGVSAGLYRADDSLIVGSIPPDYDFQYYPAVLGALTEDDISGWGVVNGVLSAEGNAVIGGWSLKAVRTGDIMVIYHPSTKNAGLDLSGYKYLTIYLYSINDDPDLTLRLKTDVNNYYEAKLNHVGGSWRRYETALKTLQRIGQPTQINWIEMETDLPSLYLDTDYLLTPAEREQLKLKFTLTRPSPNTASPKIKHIKFVWREGV